MSDIQCDSCPRNALYTLIIQDHGKERGSESEPVKFFCGEHTHKRVSACLAVPGRYSIAIDPTGQHERARQTKNKKNVVVRVDDPDKVEAEVNRFV